MESIFQKRMKSKFILIGLVLSALFIPGCIKVETAQPQISDFVGEKVAYSIEYRATGKDKLPSPQLISECSSVEINSQTFTNEDIGTITANLWIVSYEEQTNCLKFRSGNYEKTLTTSIKPIKQAEIEKVTIPQMIGFNQPAMFTLNIDLTQSNKPDQFVVRLSSTTPNLKFFLEGGDTIMDINEGQIKFETTQYQDSAKITGYILLQSEGYSEVSLSPIYFKLFLDNAERPCLVDEKSAIDIKAR